MAGWISVSPASGSVGPSGATLTLSVDPSGLIAGTYTGTFTVTFTAPDGTSKSITSNITLIVTGGPVTLSVNPESLSFSYVVGSSLPPAQQIIVSTGAADSTAPPVSFTASASSGSGGSWLAVSSANGAAPGVINASINPSGLAAGVYSGAVTIASANASNGPVTVPVTLTVSKPRLRLQPSAVTLNYQLGGVLPPSQTIAVSSSGPSLDFTATRPSVNGLVLDATSGKTPGSLGLSVNASNLRVGTYRTTITISSPGASGPQDLAVTLIVRDKPALIVSPSRLSFISERALPECSSSDSCRFTTPIAQTISIAAANTNFAASVSPRSAGTWLSIDNMTGTTPGSINVSVQPIGLEEGTYTGTISIAAMDSNSNPVIVAVDLTVVRPGQLVATPLALSFESQVGSPTTQSQSISLLSTGEVIGFSAAATGTGWLSVNPSRGTTLLVHDNGTGQYNEVPVLMSIGVTPGNLPAGTYSGSVVLTPDNFLTPGYQSPPVTISVTLTLRGDRLRIPQIVDGGNLKTAIVLVNTDSQPGTFTVAFHQADGTPLSLPLAGIGMVSQYSDTIPAGGSRTVETQGEAVDLLRGWGEVVVAGASISGTAILRQHISDSMDLEGAVPVQTGTARHFLLPFDNTLGFVTAMTILNPDIARTADVSVVFRDENGQQISTASLSTGPGNRQAFDLPSQYPELVEKRGVAEFTSSTVELSAFGIRFNPRNAFTSIEPINLDKAPPAGTSGAISQIADGGPWQTTMILVNTGATPAPFSLQFAQPDGTPWSLPVAGTSGATEYSDVIPVGGSRILQTNGTAGAVTRGWAQLVTSGSIAGTTILRQQLAADRDSEGSAPLNPPGLRNFVLPFDNTKGFATAMALTNLDPSQLTNVLVVLRDTNGQLLGKETLQLGPLTWSAFTLPSQFQETGNMQGVAEFTSLNVDLSVLGLRLSPSGSFTSVQPLRK
jgi:BACON domain-containing protein